MARMDQPEANTCTRAHAGLRARANTQDHLHARAHVGLRARTHRIVRMRQHASNLKGEDTRVQTHTVHKRKRTHPR